MAGSSKSSLSGTMVPHIDAYDLLQIGLDASEEEIKKAYKKQSLRLHPDKVQNKTSSTNETFSQLKDAYDVLSNADRRKSYDRLGVDIGEQRVEMLLWNTSMMFALGPYGMFLLKVSGVGLLCYALSFYYIYYVGLLTLMSTILYCVYLTKGKFFQGDENSQKISLLTMYASMLFLYLFLAAISQWLSDIYFLLFLVADYFGFELLLATPVLAGVLTGSAIFSWLCGGWWFTVYVGLYSVGALLALSSVMGTVIVHVWFDSLDQTCKLQVREHRQRMRGIKAELLKLREGVGVVDSMKK